MGAIDIGMAIPLPAFSRITNVQLLTCLDQFQLMRFIGIEPETVTVSAAVDRNLTVNYLLHTVVTLGTFQIVLILVVFHQSTSYLFLISLHHCSPQLITSNCPIEHFHGAIAD
jgi:hypothetical protein